MTTGKPLRWGILSAGKISHDFCVGLTTLPSEDHVITHVGARNEENAKEFAARFNIAKFSGSYDAVVKDTEVDVVYVGVIHTKHKELSILAIDHGKAVLCEKPATMNGRDLEEVLKTAEEKGIFYMEAEWTRFFPVYQDVRLKITQDGDLGEPMALMATFGYGNLNNIDRVKRVDMGGSVLLDIGIYVLLVMDMLFEGYSLVEMKACGHLNKETNVDRSVGITATFEGNRIVQLLCSGDSDLPNEVMLVCKKGSIKINKPFWSSESYTTDVCNEQKTYGFKLPEAEKQTNFPNSVGLRYEAEHVRQCLMKGLKQSPIMSFDTSRRIMGYMDEIRRQLGSTHAL